MPLISARPSFSASTTGVEAGVGQGLGGRNAAAPRVDDLPFADQRERDRGQRREIAGAAQRPVFGHDRA